MKKLFTLILAVITSIGLWAAGPTSTHIPGVYTSADGYNQTLKTITLGDYEVYGFASTGSSANNIWAGTTTTDSKAKNYVLGFATTDEAVNGWIANYVNGRGSSYSGLSASNTEFNGIGGYQMNYRNNSKLTIKVSGYDQFSFWGKDANTSDKHFVVKVDGVEQSQTYNTNSSGSLRRFDLTTGEHTIEVTATGTSNNTMWGFSLRIPAATTYTLSFDANGHGTAPDDIENLESGAKPAKPTTDPSETGWIFGGWYKEQACTNVWTWGTDEVTEDITLYAKWTEDQSITKYHVTYDLNGASGETPTQADAAEGANIELAAEPTYEGHTFLGWNDGNDTYDAGAEYTMPATDVEFTAQWCTNITPELSYNYTIVYPSFGATIIPTITGNTGEGAVSYASNNDAVATVNPATGEVTPVAAGTVTITATIEANGGYCGNTASATIKVVAAPTKLIENKLGVTSGWESYMIAKDNAKISNLVALKAADGKTLIKSGKESASSSRTPGITSNSSTTLVENDYVYFQFTIAEGYELTLTEVNIPVFSISKTGKYVARITDSNNKTIETAELSVEASKDGTLFSGYDFSESPALSGTVTVKLFAYGWGDGYRMKNELYLNGELTVAETKYNVTFDANGGEGEMATLKYAENEEVTIPECTFTAPEGKDFDVWTSEDVTISNNKFTMPAKDVTITATWKTHIVGTDATLKALSVEGFTLAPAFDPATTAYTITKAYGTENPAVSKVAATLNDANATLLGIAYNELQANEILIQTMAEDGETAGTYTINILTADAKKDLLEAKFSNGAKGYISNGNIRVPYLNGTEEPTFVSAKFWNADGEPTAAIIEDELVVTGTDGKKANYSIEYVAITPMEAQYDSITFTAVPSYIFSVYGWEAAKGVKFSKDAEDASNHRISEGKDRIYIALPAAKEVRLISGSGAERPVEILVNGVSSAVIKTAKSNEAIAITLNQNEANFIGIEANGSNGDGGFIKMLLVQSEGGSAISNTSAATKAQKRIENGQLVIEKNGKVFNAMGQTIR